MSDLKKIALELLEELESVRSSADFERAEGSGHQRQMARELRLEVAAYRARIEAAEPTLEDPK